MIIIITIIIESIPVQVLDGRHHLHKEARRLHLRVVPARARTRAKSQARAVQIGWPAAGAAAPEESADGPASELRDSESSGTRKAKRGPG